MILLKAISLAFFQTVKEGFFFFNLLNVILVQFLVFLGYSLEKQILILVDILFISTTIIGISFFAMFSILFTTRFIQFYGQILSQRS